MRADPPVVLNRYVPGELVYRQDNDTIDVGAIFAFVRRNWRLWLIWLGVGFSLGIAFWLFAPSYYTASSTVVFYDAANEGAAGAADVLPATYVDTQIAVLQSEQILDHVIDQGHLEEDGEFGSGMRTSRPDVHNATIKRVERRLSVRRVGNSDIVTVDFTSRDSARAASVANAIIASYIGWRDDLGRQDGMEAVAKLSKRLADVRDKTLSQASNSTDQSGAASATPPGRELDESRELYRATYNNLLRQAATATTPYISPIRVRVLTPAEPPLSRSWPRPIFIFGIALVVSAIIGLAHALLRELLNRSPKTVEAVEQLTGLDCVAGIPMIEPSGWMAGTADESGVQQTYLNASTGFCEALVRLTLRLQQHPPHRPFTIGVVGTTAGAGTSSVTAHLANLLAESGQKALIIDANWKKKIAHNDPEATRDPSRVLARRLAAIHLEPGKLDVVLLRATTAISPVNAANSISNALQQLASDYDCVLVDFPSADETADLDATLNTLDKVIVVADADHSPRETITGLIKRLPEAKIISVLVNKISPSTATLAEEFAKFTDPIINAYRQVLRAALPRLNVIWLRREKLKDSLSEMAGRSLAALVRAYHKVLVLYPVEAVIRRAGRRSRPSGS